MIHAGDHCVARLFLGAGTPDINRARYRLHRHLTSPLQP